VIPSLPYNVVGQVPYTYWEGPKGSKLHLVNTVAELENLCVLLKKRPSIEVDTETTGLEWFRGQHIVGVSIGWVDHHFYIPVRHEDSVTGGTQAVQLDPTLVFDSLRPILEDPTKTLILHNAKFDAHFFLNDNIDIYKAATIHDTRILWALHDEAAPGALKTIASGWKDGLGVWHEGLVSADANKNEKDIDFFRNREAVARRQLYRDTVSAHAVELSKELEYQGWKKNDLKKHVKENVLQSHEFKEASKEDIHYGYVPIEMMAQYASLDTFLTAQVYEFCMKNIDFSEKRLALYANEMKLSEALTQIGMRVNRVKLQENRTAYTDKLASLSTALKEPLGDINLRSSRELSKALVDAGIELTECTDTGELKVSKKTLSKFKGTEVVDNLLDFKTIEKLRAGYVESIDDCLVQKPDGAYYIHPSFNQNVRTGRMSCIAKGTPIDVFNKSNGVPIEQVKAGDLVYSFKPDGVLTIKQVTKAWSNGLRQVCRLHWTLQERTGYVDLTPDHRVRRPTGAWTPALELKPADLVTALPRAGSPCTYVVSSIELLGEVEVFDLSIEDTENFIANEVCVHNCTRPNVQTMPRKATEIKEMFVIPSDDYVFVMADLSQIELRLTAHFSQDPVMLDTYSKSQDIHTRTLCEMFGFNIDDVTAILKDENHPQHKEMDELRSVSKTVNFGIIYSVSARGLSEQIPRPTRYKDLSDEAWVDQCQRFIDMYFDRYLNVKRFINKGVRLTKAQGFVENYFGRIRHLPEVNATKITKNQALYWMEGKAARQGVNFIVQASAADMFKIMVVRIQQIFKGKQSRIVNLVHDDVIMYVHKSEIDLVGQVRKAMEDWHFTVPIVADFSYSLDNWSRKKKLKHS